MFSDIVTFTNIAAAVSPIQIVSMLNMLYTRFDELTEVHGVYKVRDVSLNHRQGIISNSERTTPLQF